MAKQVRWKGDFLDARGLGWRVKIWLDAEDFSEPAELAFPLDEPAVVEWGSYDKAEPVEASSLSLRVVSRSDREFAGLSAMPAGAVRVDLLRLSADFGSEYLFWSGTLDAEMYEEPYEAESGYVVSLTASDFGRLAREKSAFAGAVSVEAVANAALRASGVGTLDGCCVFRCSSTVPAASGMPAQSLLVRAENFYDEEGEPCSVLDALRAVLQPLGLKMRQRNGSVVVYDLNALCESPAMPEPARWCGSSQTLGADKAYSALRLRFSRYVADGNLLASEPWGKLEPDRARTNVNSLNPRSYRDEKGELVSYWSFVEAMASVAQGEDGAAYTMYEKSSTEGAEIIDPRVACYYMASMAGGRDSQGFRVLQTSLRVQYEQSGANVDVKGVEYKLNGIPREDLLDTINSGTESYGPQLGPSGQRPLFRMAPVRLESLSRGAGAQLLLTMPMLVSTLWDAFGYDGDGYENWSRYARKYANFIYAPVRLRLAGDDGRAYVWCNAYQCASAQFPLATVANTLGEWREEDPSDPAQRAYLAYYSADVFDGDYGTKKESACLFSFAENRQALCWKTRGMGASLKAAGSGQRLPYPPVGGMLSVEVMDRGWATHDRWGEEHMSDSEMFDNVITFGGLTWLLCEAPELRCVPSAPSEDALDADDVELLYSVSDLGAEELQLSLTCGMAGAEAPMARGMYLLPGGSQCREIERAGRRGPCEDLLASTLCSQHAQRLASLSGEAYPTAQKLGAFSEQNQGEKKFWLARERMDVRAAVSEITIVELRPDEYDKKPDEEV